MSRAKKPTKKPGDNSRTPSRAPQSDYARYSTIAIKMIAIIGGGVFGAYELDQYLQTLPIFTALLSLASVGLAIYVIVRDLG